MTGKPMMKTSITIADIAAVKLGPLETAVITAKDLANNDIEIIIPSTAIRHLAEPLLCVAAVNASPPRRPPEGRSIYGCVLPIMKWETVKGEFNGEPILKLYLAGAVLQFQLPAQTAVECGNALAAQGIAAMSPLGAKTN
jgi:hypothetical protein